MTMLFLRHGSHVIICRAIGMIVLQLVAIIAGLEGAGQFQPARDNTHANTPCTMRDNWALLLDVLH